MVSAASQGVVVEGKNSVTLNNVTLTADNNTHNSDKTDYFQAVMIYQSMSGDAAQGLSSFTMNGGKLVNKNGDVFFVNNTSTEINLDNVSITNEGDGVFLRAAASGWGTSDLNGGQVVLNASNQTITGNILVDDISTLNLYLKGYSGFTGAINPTYYDGEVYVELEKGSTWSLDCGFLHFCADLHTELNKAERSQALCRRQRVFRGQGQPGLGVFHRRSVLRRKTRGHLGRRGFSKISYPSGNPNGGK